jgi:hypothetical protein
LSKLGGHPPVFAYVGERKELWEEYLYVGETKELEEKRGDFTTLRRRSGQAEGAKDTEKEDRRNGQRGMELRQIRISEEILERREEPSQGVRWGAEVWNGRIWDVWRRDI